MMRIHRIPVRTAAASVLAAALAISAADAQSAAPVMLDGAFDEWSAAPVVVSDPADAPAPYADVREVRVRDDAEGVYLMLVLERPVSLQALDGTLQLVMNTDGEAATGWAEAGMRGVDAVVEFSPRTPNGQLAGVSLRAARRPGEAPQERPATDAGVIMSPTHAAQRFEIRLRRGEPFRFGRRLAARFVARGRGDAVVDRTEVFSAPLPPGEPRP
ncbi:MAG TPA: hypothetical protein VF665_08930, partial [Longimicrobium sp.]|uniref:hypothetical protein n=1 Tax=Longimicrobium sp. TaxID=2029185 RepID=UPI002ED8DA0B